MELKGERALPVDRATAWSALNDVDLLKAAMPGCESIVKTGDDAYDVVVNAAIGPVKARFKGRLQMSDIVAPESYRLHFDMQGGTAGFSRGDAAVRLVATDTRTTTMNYEVKASICGKLAQIGSRLVDAAASTMADRFFATFAAELAARHPAQVAESSAPVPRAPGFFATLWSFLRRLFG